MTSLLLGDVVLPCRFARNLALRAKISSEFIRRRERRLQIAALQQLDELRFAELAWRITTAVTLPAATSMSTRIGLLG